MRVGFGGEISSQYCHTVVAVLLSVCLFVSVCEGLSTLVQT